MVEKSFWWPQVITKWVSICSDIRRHSVVEMKQDVFLVTSLYTSEKKIMLRNIHIAHTTQYTTNKPPNPKMGSRSR